MLPPRTDSPDGVATGDRRPAHAADAATAQLRTRVVREPRRETWFVVNEGDADVAGIPLALAPGRSLRRVDVNGEVSEFAAGDGRVDVSPRKPLRAGQGTIVVLHFR